MDPGDDDQFRSFCQNNAVYLDQSLLVPASLPHNIVYYLLRYKFYVMMYTYYRFAFSDRR